MFWISVSVAIAVVTFALGIFFGRSWIIDRAVISIAGRLQAQHIEVFSAVQMIEEVLLRRLAHDEKILLTKVYNNEITPEEFMCYL